MPHVGSVTVTTPSSSNTNVGPARFEAGATIKTGVKEASDVVALPDGRMLVVSDTGHKLGVVSADGTASKLELEGLKKESQFEGIAFDPARKHLFLSREESREVWRYSYDPTSNQKPKLEKKIDIKHLRGAENKGLEGLAYLPERNSPTGKAQLLAVKEGSPRELIAFDDAGGSKKLPVKLDDKVKSVCHDFSAVTVDPKTGHVFISSDESSSVAEIALARDKHVLKGRLVNWFPVKDAKGNPLARIEGLAFNPKGDLFVLTENTGELLTLTRK